MTKYKKYLIQNLSPQDINVMSRSLKLTTTVKSKAQRVIVLNPEQLAYIKKCFRGSAIIDEYQGGEIPTKTQKKAEAKPVKVEKKVEAVVEPKEVPVVGAAEVASEPAVEAPAVKEEKPLKAAEAINAIKGMSTVAEVKAALKVEKKGLGRATVIKVAKDKLEELS